jgi:hypothetical protein
MSKKEVIKLKVLKMDNSQCLVKSVLKSLQDVTVRKANPPRLPR